MNTAADVLNTTVEAVDRSVHASLPRWHFVVHHMDGRVIDSVQCYHSKKVALMAGQRFVERIMDDLSR